MTVSAANLTVRPCPVIAHGWPRLCRNAACVVSLCAALWLSVLVSVVSVVRKQTTQRQVRLDVAVNVNSEPVHSGSVFLSREFRTEGFRWCSYKVNCCAMIFPTVLYGCETWSHT